ncbi:hypothetical protein V6N12_035026 [Hibiscus sabdariffa]|uniref:RNase H type-1 domain-containing protein n=1 Tax=Hibiscus sabdariffa TaxID=183260 RepID=A0ABR1ZS80_9ROSI
MGEAISREASHGQVNQKGQCPWFAQLESSALTGNYFLDGLIYHSIENSFKVQSRGHRPWRYWCWFTMIDEACVSLTNVCFHNVYREENGVADVLAKSGFEYIS